MGATSSYVPRRGAQPLSLMDAQFSPFACRVVLRAKSDYDYVIISSQASVVERTLLQRHPHLVLGQALAIEVSKSLAAVVVVESIECGDGTFSNDYSDARVSRETEIVVLPPEDREHVADAVAGGAGGMQKRVHVHWMDAISNVSSLYPLRVLPSDVRLCTSTSSSSNGDDVLADLENLCSADAVASSVIGAPSLLRDDSTCYAHPSFVRHLCSAVQCAAPPTESAGTGTSFLAVLASCDGGAESGRLVVRVALDDLVPRHHILLPTSLRGPCGAADYDSVCLAVLPVARQAGCSLQTSGLKIVLSPLQRYSRLERQDHRILLEQALMRMRIGNAPASLLLTSGQTLRAVCGARWSRNQETKVGLVAEPRMLTVSYRLLISRDDAGDEPAGAPAFVEVPAEDDGLFQALLSSLSVVHNDALIDGAQAAADGADPRPPSPPTGLPGAPPVLFEELVRSVVLDVCAAVLPLAALDGCALGAAPPLGSFLLAPARAGKTTVMRSVARVCTVCPSLLTQAVWIDLDSLRHRPARAIMEALSERFGEAARRSPSLLLIDNIDVIARVEVGSQGGESRLSALQCHLLRVHLLRLLGQLQRKRLESFHSMREALASSSREPATLLRDFFDSYQSRAVYVLASCSGPLDGAFAAACPFKTLFRVPRLDASLRLRYLERQLCLPDDEQSRVQLADVTATAGTVGDLHAMMKSSLSSVVERRHAGGAAEGPLALEESALARLQLGALLHAGRAVVADDGGAVDPWVGVWGLARAKEQIRDVIHLPIIFHRLFCQSPTQLPRALLLYGPPGCGKTWLANAAGAMMNELHFVSVRGAQLLQKYVGASERAVRDLFDGARASGKPTLIFFDEIEALAPRRGKDSTGVTDRVVNQLLTCIDGIDAAADGASADGALSQVYVIAASSRPDMIDPALLRPGRIQVHVHVGLPSAEERREILQRAVGALPCGFDKDRADVKGAIERILGHPRTECFTRADLQAVVGLAHMEGAVHAVEAGQLQAQLTGEALWIAFLNVGGGVADCEELMAVYRNFGRREGTGTVRSESLGGSPLTSPAKQIQL